ncbi:MAG TPA: GH25 family lysozyme [Solirubrobacterales bacterium]|nr:GH25 family lysozyme [Solirubrobacterales bacterium]
MRRTKAALIAALLILLGLGAPGAGAYTNGELPESALAPIATGVKCERPEGQLANTAAAAYNSMALASARQLPDNGCDSAYRPLARQVYYRAFWCLQGLCANAALPGTSNHGWGTAIDASRLTVGVIEKIGRHFCWAKTEAPSEWWHQNYTGCYHRPDPGLNLHSPTLRQHSGGPGQGAYVRKAEKLLRGHGFKELDPDGRFTFQTKRIVKRFQEGQRIPVTGVINKRTWKRLRRPISKPVKTTPEQVPAAGAPAPAAHPLKKRPHPKKLHHKHHTKHRAPNRKAWGIDVSSNNGCSIDFAAVRRDGATFAVTKATESTTYVNPCFGRAQVRAIGAAHLVPGVYHWLSPGGASGRAEAAFFANTIGHAGYGKGFLQPFVDVEEATSQSDAAVCHEVGEFVHTLKQVLGEKPIVYTYPGYVAEHLSSCGFLNHYRLWIANIGVAHPTVPSPPWSSWALWQYTWTASVAGVAGQVDVSKVYGGTSALAKLRVRDLPRRVREPPRARTVKPALAGASSVELKQLAPEPINPLGALGR